MAYFNIILNKFKENTFIRVSSLNGIITIAKSALAIFLNKVIATLTGTSGTAMVGQLQNLISIVTLASNGGFNQGLTKYIAENKSNESQIKEFVITSFLLTSILSLVAGSILYSLSGTISQNLFSNNEYKSIVIVFAVTLIFYNLNSLMMAIINGFQDYKFYFQVNLVSAIASFLLSVILVLIYNELGALLSLVLSQSIVFIFIYFPFRQRILFKSLKISYFNKTKAQLLFKYTTMTLLTAIIWPLVSIVLRTHIINHISKAEAGYWQATRNLNDYIVNIAIGSFSVYLLPRLATLTDNHQLKKELIGIYKVIIPISLIAFIILYIFRETVILILYTKDFLKVGDYLLLQMVGSFFWMCKVPIMNFLLSKGHTQLLIKNEIGYAVMYILLCFLFIPNLKVQGIQLSFAIYNFSYLVTNIILIRKYLK